MDDRPTGTVLTGVVVRVGLVVGAVALLTTATLTDVVVIRAAVAEVAADGVVVTGVGRVPVVVAGEPARVEPLPPAPAPVLVDETVTQMRRRFFIVHTNFPVAVVTEVPTLVHVAPALGVAAPAASTSPATSTIELNDARQSVRVIMSQCDTLTPGLHCRLCPLTGPDDVRRWSGDDCGSLLRFCD